ncbi:MAG: hypothetical protein ACXABY_16280 [Candidatus Thorarchaeota archaeon]|jgi:hypothetical protein
MIYNEHLIGFLKDVKNMSAYEQIEKNKRQHKIRFVVNSHVDYYVDTLPLLLGSMLEQIPAKDIVVVLAGGDEEDISMIEGVEFNLVTHNSWDFTSHVHLVENLDRYKDTCDYWFYLHDTCQCLKYFSELVYDFQEGAPTYAIWDKSTHNLGLYSTQHLVREKHRILRYKGGDQPVPNDIGLLVPARKAESTLFVNREKWHYNRWSTLNDVGMGDKLLQIVDTNKFPEQYGNYGYKDVYGTGKSRRCMLFKNVNLCKFQSPQNTPWGGA